MTTPSAPMGPPPPYDAECGAALASLPPFPPLTMDAIPFLRAAEFIASYHETRFWMITTNLANGGWQVAEDIEDALRLWSEPIRLTEVSETDPDIAWDDDRALLRYVAGGITGRLIGVWCWSGDLLVDYFGCLGAGDTGLLP